MRGLSARRIASTALCATLLVGIAGPAAVAADSAPERTHAVSRAPVPGADALLAQVKSLGDLGGVLAPVAALLNSVLKADNGQLSADEAQKLVTAVKDAIANITAAAPAASGTVTKPGASAPVSPSSLTKLPASAKPGTAARRRRPRTSRVTRSPPCRRRSTPCSPPSLPVTWARSSPRSPVC